MLLSSLIPLLTILSFLPSTLSTPNPPPIRIGATIGHRDLSTPTSPNLISRATTCNGSPSLCTRLYSNVTYIGAHDSYAVGQTVAHNQAKNVTQQLNDGVRMLQVQAHLLNGAIHLCHTSCSLLDAGTLTSYLQPVKTWLDSHPNEVVTLLIVNIDNQSPSLFSQSFSSASLTSYVYSPPSATTSLDNWPTLGSMIDAGTRLVVFMDNTADFASVPWIIDEFSNVWEDAYDVTSQDFACAVNRTSGAPSTTMYITNHFLDNYGTIFGIQTYYPATDKLNQTNAATGYGSIGQGASNCISIWGRAPNFILLDFYDSQGNAPFNVAASLNGIAAPSNTVVPAETGVAATASASKAVVSSSSLSGSWRRVDGMGVVMGLSMVGAVVLGVMVV